MFVFLVLFSQSFFIDQADVSSSCSLFFPADPGYTRNAINFLVFQAFLLYVHYMREHVERKTYTLRDQLKIQFKVTQKAQVTAPCIFA
ncbi:hypothetical protein BJ322DRAFT_1014389 [Thelephora terrestris]|uniref:Uncharacterized protein n=1 Tax=Thelephora terrestris TaxID=56493 RepID=A0A9P6H477_9AGAM|nr:hypothetical protein BJ322DRAFT_1014389 [Thelephora terrestris]